MKKLLIASFLMLGLVGVAKADLPWNEAASYDTVSFSSYNVLLNYGKPVAIWGVIFSTPSVVQGTNGEFQYVLFRATNVYTGTQLTGNTSDFSTNNEAFRIHQSTTANMLVVNDATPANGGLIKMLPLPIKFPKGCAYKPSNSSVPRVTVIYRDLF